LYGKKSEKGKGKGTRLQEFHGGIATTPQLRAAPESGKGKVGGARPGRWPAGCWGRTIDRRNKNEEEEKKER